MSAQEPRRPKAVNPLGGDISNRQIARWTFILAIFTAFLFVTSAVSDLLIWRQSSIAAQAQSDIREASRAYFGLGEVVQIPTADLSGNPTATFVPTWENFGSTRTKWAEAWSSIVYFRDGVPNSVDFSKPWQKMENSRVVVGPNKALQIGPIGVSSDDMSQAANGVGVLIIWGNVDYADIMNPNVTRHSRFCLRLVPAGKAVDPTGKITRPIFQAQRFRADCNAND